MFIRIKAKNKNKNFTRRKSKTRAVQNPKVLRKAWSQGTNISVIGVLCCRRMRQMSQKTNHVFMLMFFIILGFYPWCCELHNSIVSVHCDIRIQWMHENYISWHILSKIYKPTHKEYACQLMAMSFLGNILEVANSTEIEYTQFLYLL